MQVDVPTPLASQDTEPEKTAEEVEAKKTSSDLKKLRYMALDQQREVAHLDILGEWGSKVSYILWTGSWKINFLIKHLLYYRAKEPQSECLVR